MFPAPCPLHQLVILYLWRFGVAFIALARFACPIVHVIDSCWLLVRNMFQLIVAFPSIGPFKNFNLYLTHLVL